MGADFIEKTKDRFRKCWDRGRVDLATADLFTRIPRLRPLVMEADLVGPACPKPGDRLVMREEGGALFGYKGSSKEVHVASPPGTIVQAVQESCGVAAVRIESVDHLSGVAEIVLEP